MVSTLTIQQMSDNQTPNEAQLTKLFYTIGEVSKMLGEDTSTVRYWEKEFSIIKPQRNAKGNRLFRQVDVENLKLICHLLRDRHMTLEGAKQMMRDKRDEATKDTQIVEHLKKMREMLLQMRDNILASDN